MNMSKKTLKNVPARQEKESSSWGLIPIAAITILFIGAVVWFVFFNSNSDSPPITDPALVGNGHAKGNLEAKVTIVEFSDFQCPACGAAFPAAQQMFEQFKDRIRFVYRHFPLTGLHPFAVSAAEASECAAEQEKFWEMHDSLFQQQSSWTAASNLDEAKQNIRSIADSLGLDLPSFDQCLSSREKLSKVQEDMDAAVRFGINSTPTFFINGKMVRGGMTVETFSREIEAALAKAG
jgi:protein-disulfide isomerase